MRRGVVATILFCLAVAVLVLSILAPVFRLLVSISGANGLTALPLHWLPDTPDFARYARLFSLTEDSAGKEFLVALRNSLTVALLLARDEFFHVLLDTGNSRANALPVAIADFAAGRATGYGLTTAVGLLAAPPPVRIEFLLQKSLLAGLSAGSVKGRA